MTITELLRRLDEQPASLMFEDVMQAIDAAYQFQPVAFDNGTVINAAGSNAGSCRVLAFARLHKLDPSSTLALFGEHYRDVLAEPDGDNHANIRAFMESGWAGVTLHGQALSPRP